MPLYRNGESTETIGIYWNNELDSDLYWLIKEYTDQFAGKGITYDPFAVCSSGSDKKSEGNDDAGSLNHNNEELTESDFPFTPKAIDEAVRLAKEVIKEGLAEQAADGNRAAQQILEEYLEAIQDRKPRLLTREVIAELLVQHRQAKGIPSSSHSQGARVLQQSLAQDTENGFKWPDERAAKRQEWLATRVPRENLKIMRTVDEYLSLLTKIQELANRVIDTAQAELAAEEQTVREIDRDKMQRFLKNPFPGGDEDND